MSEQLLKEQLHQEVAEKYSLYQRVKELSDEVYVLKGQVSGLEFQISEYKQIVKELSERLSKNG